MKRILWKTTGQVFRETEKLVSGQTETTGINLINFQDLKWVSTSLLHSRAYQYSTAKVYVFSESVLCLGKKETIPMEFDWKIFPRFTTVAIFNEMMGELKCEPKIFTHQRHFLLFPWTVLFSAGPAPLSPIEGCTPGRVFARRSVHHLVCRLLQSFSLFRWSSLIDRQR